jgi:hypothetical protein
MTIVIPPCFSHYKPYCKDFNKCGFKDECKGIVEEERELKQLRSGAEQLKLESLKKRTIKECLWEAK